MFISKRILIQFADDYITLGRTNAQPFFGSLRCFAYKSLNYEQVFFLQEPKKYF